ncbi:carbohydrate ABC transporter permease [Brachyspira aalborgi]|uniref:carbohydrate ABC transporter permease n=1 Tax=Brachyspira aalborgi TaxID=29522 RepID=UPI0018F433FF|nr:carbohydrate ABC transporter permease [Brachyspira aalborgi]
MKIRNLPYIFVYAILIVYAIITLIPFLWTVLSSFKTYAEIVGREFTFLPKTWTLGNYKYLLGSEPLFLRWIFNSVFIGLSVTFLNVLFNTMCGYALARLSFRGKSILLYVIILILAVPNQILMIPSYVILYNLGWIDDYKAMIIPSMINATYIFMMRQFFINFPKDVE